MVAPGKTLGFDSGDDPLAGMNDPEPQRHRTALPLTRKHHASLPQSQSFIQARPVHRAAS